jgi:CRP/FNR family transcriptional regulator, anaerobic regulatory protein
VPHPARFALLRPELHESLERGEAKIIAMMKPHVQVAAPGQILIEANSDHPYVYRLREGWACRTRRLPDGREQCILIFLPGDLFALKSIFISRHPDAVQLLSRSILERLDYRELHGAYLRDGDIANRCTWQVMEEERRLHSWVTGLGQGSAEERLALLLMDFHGRLAMAGRISADTMTFEMPLTQSQLADHLGITSIHVNRVLKVLRDRGIVTVREGCVTISNLAELTRAAYALLDPYERSAPQYVGTRASPLET